MNALIFVNGPLPQRRRLQRPLQEADLILCANGGANRALAIGISPDFVIGDLDSIDQDVRTTLDEIKFIYKPGQENSDLEKTLQFAVEKSITKVTIVGISGGRLDHQICNLNILEKFCDRLEIEILEECGSAIFVRDKAIFAGVIGQQISIFAFRQVSGVTTKGLKFPLNDAELEWAVSDGLSNEIVANPVEIVVKTGTLFVFRVWPD